MSNTPAATTSKNRFSLVTALSDAFTYVLRDFVPLSKLSWPYFVTASALSGVAFILIHFFAKGGNDTAIHFTIGFGFLAALLLSTAFYIAVGRNWLFAESDPSIARVYLRLLLRVLVLTVLLTIVAAIIFLPPFALGTLAFVYYSGDDDPSAGLVIAGIVGVVAMAAFALAVTLYIAGRMTPWFVAAVAEAPMRLSESWTVTKGAGFRILIGLIALTLAFSVSDFAIEMAFAPLLGANSDAFDMLYRGEKLPVLFVALLLKIAVYIVQVAASMVYAASLYRQTSSRG